MSGTTIVAQIYMSLSTFEYLETKLYENHRNKSFILLH